MAIELSNLTFTDEDDIVPLFGAEQILNTGIANTFAGNDRITGTYGPDSDIGFKNVGVLNTDDGNDTITGIGNPLAFDIGESGIFNSGTFNMGEGDDVITGKGDSVCRDVRRWCRQSHICKARLNQLPVQSDRAMMQGKHPIQLVRVRVSV